MFDSGCDRKALILNWNSLKLYVPVRLSVHQCSLRLLLCLSACYTAWIFGSMWANQTQQPPRPLCAGSAVQLLCMQSTAKMVLISPLSLPVMVNDFKNQKFINVGQKMKQLQKFHVLLYVCLYKWEAVVLWKCESEDDRKLPVWP